MRQIAAILASDVGPHAEVRGVAPGFTPAIRLPQKNLATGAAFAPVAVRVAP
ncbi:MAG: hypothetical protein WDN03_16700 [Rhizomicrobium sp.]